MIKSVEPLTENDWQIFCPFQTTFNYSKSVIKILDQCEICSKLTMLTTEVNDVALLYSLLAFHTLFCSIVDFEEINTGWVSGQTYFRRRIDFRDLFPIARKSLKLTCFRVNLWSIAPEMPEISSFLKIIGIIPSVIFVKEIGL